jgi:hypothetical protein
MIENRRFGTLATIACPKSADSMATVENWFTDELPEVSLYEDDDDA